MHCTVASEIREGYPHLVFWRWAEARTLWLAKIEAELERQLQAIEEFMPGDV